MDAYEVLNSELKLEDGSRHPPGATVTSEDLTSREEAVFLRHDEIRPLDETTDDEGGDDGGAETSVEHDVPPDEDDEEEEEGGLDWENDYHDAQAKASELGLDATGTHEELTQRIEEAR